MKVIKVNPQGYCHGVVKALNIVTKAIKNLETRKPIYILGHIVHNKIITDFLSRHGVITLDDNNKTRYDLLDEIQNGTIIFTAHGVSKRVKEKASSKKNVDIINAVCIDVEKTHKLVDEYIQMDYEIFYIGKKSHPETEGIIENNKKIYLIESIKDIENINNIENDKILITNQTTLSLWDVATVSNAIIRKFPTAKFIKEICNATRVRQEAVVEYSKMADLFIIVGDSRSNNTNKLLEIALKEGVESYRIESIEELNISWLKQKEVVAVTSGASTPIKVTNKVITFLTQFNYIDKSTWDKEKFKIQNDVIPQLKIK